MRDLNDSSLTPVEKFHMYYSSAVITYMEKHGGKKVTQIYRELQTRKMCGNSFYAILSNMMEYCEYSMKRDYGNSLKKLQEMKCNIGYAQSELVAIGKRKHDEHSHVPAESEFLVRKSFGCDMGEKEEKLADKLGKLLDMVSYCVSRRGRVSEESYSYIPAMDQEFYQEVKEMLSN